jgi:hypothetical protein
MTTAVALLAPAAAQAHHIAASGAECKLVGNVPTITAQATFASFASYNKPIAGKLDVDAATVATITGFTFSGSNGTWQSGAVPTTPGKHHVTGTFWWPRQDNANGRFDADVTCPAPPPPPPTPTPTPTPTPEPPVVTPPVVATEGAVAQKAPRCVPKKLGRYRITVTPKHAMHGLVTFHLRGHGVRQVRWYVDTRRAAQSARTWEYVRRNGRAYSVYLWAQERWGVHLWGRHTVEARFRVTNSCGKVRAVRVQRLYFNHDPLPDDPIFAH